MSQTPEQIAAETHRRHLIIDLRYAIDGMAERYADSRGDWTIYQVTGNPDLAAKHSRAAKRQRKALQRLTSALANLAVGA
jgi:IS4 transposase